MIVVAHHERRGRMRGLQIRIELVEAVAVPVVVERVAFIRVARHHADDGNGSLAGAHHAALVDVIAEAPRPRRNARRLRVEKSSTFRRAGNRLDTCTSCEVSRKENPREDV